MQEKKFMQTAVSEMATLGLLGVTAGKCNPSEACLMLAVV